MITGFIIENQTTKKRVTFGQKPAYDYVYKDDGLDWGYAPATHSTYFYPEQVGEHIAVTNITGREVTITGYVHYVPDEVDRSNYDKSAYGALVHQKVLEKKEVLNSLVNPMDFVRIIVGDFYLEGKPTRSIQYGQTMEENNELFCLFVMNIYCPNPMFHKVISPNTIVTGSQPYWHFPLSIPDNGFKFSTRVDYMVISVENEGNTTVGGIITIKADGEVQNPTIELVGTGKKFTINKTLQRNEVVVIDTRNSEDRGVNGGITEADSSYFKYWDVDNDWLQFTVGSNLVGYSTDNESELLMTVIVEIRPERYAVEEQ